MARRDAAAALAAAAACVVAAVLPGCGHAPSGDPLQTRATDTRILGELVVERLSYSSSDGRRVPAVFVTPRGFSPRGCLMWQNGLGARKEDPAEIWRGAARLGLAVLTVDLPQDGVGDGVRRGIPADPRRLAALVPGWVSDLGRAVDLLERRPECRRTIGFAGLGLGGMLGSVLAGRDARLRALLIASTPPTWRSLTATADQTADRTLAALDPVSWIPRIAPRPMMVLIGRDDPLVPARAAAQLRAAAPEPKRIVVHRGRDPFAAAHDSGAAFEAEQFLLRWLVRPTYA